MSVAPKRYRKCAVVAKPEVTAAMVLVESNPWNVPFMAWLKSQGENKVPTKRKASEFLAIYRNAKQA